MKGKKLQKRFLAGVMALAMAGIVSVSVPGQVQAADTAVVKYEKVEYTSFAAAIDSSTAPEMEGYLFGGWYKYTEDRTGEAIKNASEVSAEDMIAAKYVRADMAGIACQLNLDENNGKRDMRIVSLVDSPNYRAVGFNVYGRRYNETTGRYGEWLMYRYGSERAVQSEKIYSGLKVYQDSENYTVKTPKDVFGADAEGFYFTTMLLRGIPEAEYDTIVAIKPYWITLDGTYVEGMGEFDRVNDGRDGIVNVSVNLKQAADIGAGFLQVTYDTEKFQYLGADCGRVFSEMEIAQTGDGIIKCVGNVADITCNSENPNDVYVNLRFRKLPGNDLPAGGAAFKVTVPENGFCGIDESIAAVTAPDVRY